MLQIKCVVCGSLNNIPMQPNSDSHVMLCYDCDKQLAGGTENFVTNIVEWSIYDDCELIQPLKRNTGQPAVDHYWD